MTELTTTGEVILDWYRADQPIPFHVWAEQPEATRQAFVEASLRCWVERCNILTAMQHDAPRVLAEIDGGKTQRRADLMRALAEETRRRNGGNSATTIR